MPRHDGTPNLRPQNTRTKAEQKKIARKGGKASGKARREKRLLSQIYGDLLADQSGIRRGKGFRAVASEILNSTDKIGRAVRVTLMKEIREATEGSKIKTETVLTINVDDEKVQQVLKDFGVNKAEPEN